MGFVAVKCPQCGADIQLDDSREFGFCNYCGTKVMQDKILVEHSGSVKIDDSDKLQNLYKLARRARENNDSENAAKYYSTILTDNPDDWEANFFSSYYEAMSMKLFQYDSAVTKIRSASISALDIVKENLSGEELEKAVTDISGSVLSATTMLVGTAKSHYEQFSSASNSFGEYTHRAYGAISGASVVGVYIDKLFYGVNESCGLVACLLLVSCNELLASFAKFWYSNSAYPDQGRRTYDFLNQTNTDVIKKYQPTYISPYYVPTVTINKTNKEMNRLDTMMKVQDTGNKILLWLLILGIPLAIIIMLIILH